MRTAYRVVHHTYSSPETAYRVVHHRPEQVLATLEGAQGCLLFSSGIAAADAMLRALLKPGDCLVLPRLGYFAIRKHAAAHAAHINVEVREL